MLVIQLSCNVPCNSRGPNPHHRHCAPQCGWHDATICGEALQNGVHRNTKTIRIVISASQEPYKYCSAHAQEIAAKLKVGQTLFPCVNVA